MLSVNAVQNQLFFSSSSRSCTQKIIHKHIRPSCITVYIQLHHTSTTEHVTEHITDPKTQT